MITLDEIDYRLLDLVQTDAARPLHELGDRIGLSPSAVQRRLTRLRAGGVIRGEVAVLDPRALGADMTAVVLVALADDDAEHDAAFERRLLAEPAVQQCYRIIGQWDYVIVLITADIAENRALSTRLFLDDPVVRRYETLPAYGTVKSGQAVPIRWAPRAGPGRSPG